jgi:hypothetical protein
MTSPEHSNLFHEALVKVHDITTNEPFNTQSWQAVREVVNKALAEARRIDRADIDAGTSEPTLPDLDPMGIADKASGAAVQTSAEILAP